MGALNLSAESTATEASEHCIDRKELVANQLTIQDKWVLLASLKTIAGPMWKPVWRGLYGWSACEKHEGFTYA